MSRGRLRVLYIDDEPDNLRSFELNCEDHWDLTLRQDGADLYSGKLSPRDFDAILVDLVLRHLPGEPRNPYPDPSPGIRLVKWLHENFSNIPVAIVTAILGGVENHFKEEYPRVLRLEKPINFSAEEFRTKIESLARGH